MKSVFRYPLWDIDLIINRTLVYGALKLSTMGIYLGWTLRGIGNTLAKASDEENQSLMEFTDRVVEIQNTLRVDTPVTLSGIEVI